MPTIVKGQPTSAEVRQALAKEGRPVLVSMSLGKDAIATELALQDSGIPTELVFLYLIPGLPFVEDTRKRLEDDLGKTIHQYPHPSLFRLLNALVFQPPERCAVIEAAQLPTPTYDQTWELIKDDLDLPQDTWQADGVRAADSIVRRASLTKHGVMKRSNHKVSPIHDWLKGEVMDCIDRHEVALPVDYEWFGRSFDGIDYRFLAPLKEHSPRDYARVLDWFPLADLEIFRHNMQEAA